MTGFIFVIDIDYFIVIVVTAVYMVSEVAYNIVSDSLQVCNLCYFVDFVTFSFIVFIGLGEAVVDVVIIHDNVVTVLVAFIF